MTKNNTRHHTNGRKVNRIHHERNKKAYFAPYKVFDKVTPVPISSLRIQAASVAWIADYESKNKAAKKQVSQ